MSEIVRLSLVICSRNRAPQLQKCLNHVVQLQSARSWELVIVDNGSTDETPEVIEEFQARYPRRIRQAFEPRPGLGGARNRGSQLARGGIISFSDDDCYPDPHFIDAVIAAFDADESVGFVGGRIELYDPTDYPITIQQHPSHIHLLPRRVVSPGLIQGANLSVRRSALEDCGGFDDLFGAGASFACEDIDVVARIAGLGWKGVYDPGVLVLHHHGRKGEAVASHLMRQYDRGRGAYFAKCLMNPALRTSALRYWAGRVVRQPVRTTLREVAAALSYIAASARGSRVRIRSHSAGPPPAS